MTKTNDHGESSQDPWDYARLGNLLLPVHGRHRERRGSRGVVENQSEANEPPNRVVPRPIEA
jgi:hypothetical protein